MRRSTDRGHAKLGTGLMGVLARALERGLAVPLAPLRASHELHGTPVPYKWLIKYAGNCVKPIVLEKTGQHLTKGPNHPVVFGKFPLERPIMLDMEVRCRECQNCLKARAAHWRLRATTEIRSAERTWFGSLTLNPTQHHRVLSACRAEAARNGDDFDKFPPSVQFAARHKCISREITLFLKRIRKESGASIRLLCVAEAHKSGLPHYHMLVHEGSSVICPHRVLKKQWRVGFSQWKLVRNPRAAVYVTKYLGKSMMARVRASLDYGTSLDIVTQSHVNPNDPPEGGGTYLPTGWTETEGQLA